MEPIGISEERSPFAALHALAPERLRPLVFAGERFAAAFAAAGADEQALACFHAAERAWEQARLALEQDREDDAFEAAEEARRLSWRARGPVVVVVCGLSGSGKTTLAGEIGAVSGLDVLSSDLVRKELAGVPPDERADPEHYSGEFNRRTYAELGRRARGGTGAIVDATFRHAEDRRAFLGELDGPVWWVQCTAPLEVLVERLSDRRPGPSDATPEVVREQEFDWLAEADAERHLTVRTDRPAPAIVRDLEAWLDARLVAQAGSPS
jgi:predicted kinase